MTTHPGGTIPQNTLATVRALYAQITGLQAQLDQLVTAAIEGAGHDIAALQLTAMDLATGVYTLAARPTTQKPRQSPAIEGVGETASGTGPSPFGPIEGRFAASGKRNGRR